MKHLTIDRSPNDKMLRYFVTSQISENIHETPEGYLVCVGVPIARTGEMIYGEGETPLETDDDGKVVINRSDEEVFRPETIASFEGKPVTITHPTEFVSPENWPRLAKGILQNVRRGEGDQENDLIADLLITDSMAISLVKNGLREVSCGYEAEYTQTGKGRGEQSNIVGNHLALVEQGRAGSGYAILDHKGKGENGMTKFEKLLAKLGLTKDSVMAKAIDEALKDEEKKDDKKDESKDAGAYDELCKMVKDLSEKVSALAQPKDEEKKDDKKDEGKDEEQKPDDKKDEEQSKDEGETSLEDRLKALETAVAKLLESKDADGEESEDEEPSMGHEKEESEDEEGMLTGDEASRVEILAPGLKPTKDSKAQALKKAYETKDGKKVIDQLTGGKAPTFDSAEKVETLFIAASELLKVSRSNDLSRAKQTRDNGSENKGPMTPDQINEINKKHYGLN